MTKEEVIEERKTAMIRFLDERKLSQVQVARILGVDRSVMSRACHGSSRTSDSNWALIYHLTQNDVFLPQTKKARAVFDKVTEQLPKTLISFLEDGIIPEFKERKKEKLKETKKPRKIILKEPEQKPPQEKEPEPEQKPRARTTDFEMFKTGVNSLADSSLLIIFTMMKALLKDTIREVVSEALEEGLGGGKVLGIGQEAVLRGSCYDLVFSGMLDLKGQEVDGVRFVITKDNFQPMEGKFTEAEIKDTVALIRELRRRFNLIAQNSNITARAQPLKALSREVDELYTAIILSKEAVPTKAANMVSELRKTFANVSGHKRGGK